MTYKARDRDTAGLFFLVGSSKSCYLTFKCLILCSRKNSLKIIYITTPTQMFTVSERTLVTEGSLLYDQIGSIGIASSLYSCG